jgi:hypothetical protein
MSSIRLVRHLALAEATFAEIERLAAEATVFLQTSGYQMTQRDRVLAALLSETDGAFRALIEDCRAVRGEAMHHLKTMAEVFIYVYVVSADDTDRTADGLIAERVAEQHARRLRRLTPTSEYLKTWESLACQSAHLGDLLEWMPSDEGQILIGETARTKTGQLTVGIAIEYGVEIVLGLLEAISRINVAGLRVDTSGFRAELAAIRGAKEST